MAERTLTITERDQNLVDLDARRAAKAAQAPPSGLTVHHSFPDRVRPFYVAHEGPLHVALGIAAAAVITIPELVNHSTPVVSQVLGILCLFATVAISHRLARYTLNDDVLAFSAMVILLINLALLSPAMRELGTSVQTVLITSVMALLLPSVAAARGRLALRRIAAGVLAAGAIIVSPDSAVLVGGAILIHLLAATDRRPSRGRARSTLVGVAQVALPLAAVLGVWLVLKQATDRTLLPDSLTSGSSDESSVTMLLGLAQLTTAVEGYLLFVVAAWMRFRQGGRRAIGPLFEMQWLIPVWLLYIVLGGGDSLEFQFLVPITPLLAIVIAALLDD